MSDTQPKCPFCSAPWSEDMLAEFDSMTGSSDCACCTGQAPAEPLPMPTRDLCCATCGRAIYQNPFAHVHA